MTILLVLMIVVTLFLMPIDSVRKYGFVNASNYEILSEKENTIDAIAVGDSLIYSGISPMEIWKEFGFTVFDCATQGQLIRESYRQIEMAFKNQKPKVVFLEANVIYRDAKNKPWYYDYQQLIKRYVPFSNYHNNWKKLISSLEHHNANFSKVNVYKGYRYVNNTKSGKLKNYMKYTTKKASIPEENKIYFDKIVELCKKNQVRLVVISTPSMVVWNYKKHNGIVALTESYGIEYIDLNIDNALNINWKKESRDEGDHLNYLGAKKMSHFIGTYLQEHHLAVDHREDEAYASWHHAYAVYEENLE